MLQSRFSLIRAATILIALTLAACGGGGGGGSSSGGGGSGGGSGTTSNQVTGHAVASYISGAVVEVYELKEIGVIGTELVASTTTDANGQFTLNMTGLKGDFFIKVIGGTYVDEATGTTMTNGTLRGVLFNWESGSEVATVSVTPLSELAIRISESMRPEDILTAFQKAAILAGGIDLNSTVPQVLSVSTSGADRNALEYGAALAALSQLQRDGSHASVDALLALLAGDYADDKIDGYGQAFIDAFEAFIAGTQNQSDFDNGQTAIPGSVQVGMSFIQPIDNLTVVDCERVSCAQPNVQGLSVRSDVAKPFPEGCDLNVPGDCSAGDVLKDSCYGNICLTYTERPAEGAWYNGVCSWFWKYDNDVSRELCPGGRGLGYSVTDGGTNRCVSISNGYRQDNPGACPLNQRLTLVVPSDTNLRGALYVHSNGRKRVTRGSNAHHPFRDRRLVSDYGNFVDADCEQVGADARCYAILNSYLDPAWIDNGQTVSFLTTYGYEWDIQINIPAGQHMICNIMNGECKEKINTGAEGEVKVTLSWETKDVDLDVHLYDPCIEPFFDNYIYYGNKTQECNGKTGELDVDDLGGGNLVENIAYADGAPSGAYRVEVNNFDNTSTPVAYTLKIIYGTEVDIYTGSIGNGPNHVYEFTLNN